MVFESDPPGAEVRFADGAELLGVTPFRRALARSTDEITFEIRLAGYDSMRVPTPATSNRTISVGLTREPPAAPAVYSIGCEGAATVQSEGDPRHRARQPRQRRAGRAGKDARPGSLIF